LFTRGADRTIVQALMTNKSDERGSTGLDGRTALVIGATGGIGAAIAGALAEGGAVLTIHGRDDSRLAAKASELAKYGNEVGTIRADLSEGRAPPELLRAAASIDLYLKARAASARVAAE